MTTLLFLYNNGKWLQADNLEFYSLTIWVARSLPIVKDGTVKGIETFIKKHLVNFDE